MKKLLFILMLIPALAFAGSYTAITGDNEVDSKDQVVVQRVKSIEKTSEVTLNKIDRTIADREARIVSLQATIDKLKAERVLVEAEAKKVKLKAKNND